ncbi:fibroblast growth factor receptor 1-A-like [Oscarella lobularis]|uniref:fibroblast growth factor receptor 1-A-like n=1 Tax=Oscarella lobularis TaxID=121494 RepID=UPI003313A783
MTRPRVRNKHGSALTRFHIDNRSPKSLVPMKLTAPESLPYRVFTESSDVWSFGSAWEIATLESAPYPGVPVEKLYDILTKGDYRMRKPRTCSRKLHLRSHAQVQGSRSARPTETSRRGKRNRKRDFYDSN